MIVYFLEFGDLEECEFYLQKAEKCQPNNQDLLTLKKQFKERVQSKTQKQAEQIPQVQIPQEQPEDKIQFVASPQEEPKRVEMKTQ